MNRITFKQINHALFGGLLGPLFHQTHMHELPFSVDQGHNSPLHSFADIGVSFHVANQFSFLDECWTLLYASLAGCFATFASVCTSFSTLLLLPKMFVQLNGIPAPFGAAVVLFAAFRWWNRMCEFSADRAGLLACGDLNLGVSALVRLAAPNIRNQQEFERALAMLDAQDDQVNNRLAELFQTHPMLIRRIEKLRDYARTEEYRWLQTGVNRNVGVEETKEVTEFHASEAQEPPQSPEERWTWLKPKS